MKITYTDYVKANQKVKSGIVKAYNKSESFKKDFPHGHKWPIVILERMLYNPMVQDIDIIVMWLNGTEN